MEEVSSLILMRKGAGEGSFILGEKPSYSDFFVAGSLQSAKMVDEGTFERMMSFEGQRAVYEACLPWMERKD